MRRVFLLSLLITFVVSLTAALPVLAQAPTITSFTPTSGPVGTAVTITGTNFAGTTLVGFQSQNATSFTVNGAGTQITTAVPAGAATGLISVKTPAGQAQSASSFTVAAAPAAPTAFTATGDDTQIELSWTAPPGAVTSYNLYRGTAPGAEGTTAYKTGLTSPSYTDTRLTNGTAYYYKVSAVNGAGEGPKSSETSATPGIYPPTNITVTPGESRTLITWTGRPKATNYNLYRSTTSGGSYTLIGSSSLANTTGQTIPNFYLDEGLTDGTSYYYVVAMVGTSSTTPSGYSVQASGTPVAQSGTWTLTPPAANSSFTSPANATSPAVVTASSNQTELTADAIIAGNAYSGPVSAQASYSGKWALIWTPNASTPNAYPTLLTVASVHEELYDASYYNGTGSASVGPTGGTNLVSVSSASQNTSLPGVPSATSTFGSSDLTNPRTTTTITNHTILPTSNTGATETPGWSEHQSTVVLTNITYTGAYLAAHFSSASSIKLTYTVTSEDVTAVAALSTANSTSGSNASFSSATASVIDNYLTR